MSALNFQGPHYGAPYTPLFYISDITINGDSFSWSHPDAVISGDVVVHPVEDKLETFMVEIDGGRVSVVVNRHDGPIAGKYLGTYVVRVDGLSELSKGMIGKYKTQKCLLIITHNSLFTVHYICLCFMLPQSYLIAGQFVHSSFAITEGNDEAM